MKNNNSFVSEKGSRPKNEDTIGCFINGANRCFVVCDGLGGHGMGDAASQLVVDVFENQFLKTADMKEFLPVAFTAAQQILLSEQIERNAKRKMKTTCTALVTDEKFAYIGHVGDSRLYVFQKNKVKMRTLDHSIPQMLVLSKEIKESEIRNHPDRNVLLRVMGIDWEKPMFELETPLKLKKTQAFLLCSDGFWELIEEADMCRLLQNASSAKDWLDQMSQLVRQNGEGRNMDNYSAIAVWNTK